MVGELMIRRTASLLYAALLLATVPLTFAEPVQTDPQTGLTMATDWELVRSNCIACHSAKLITQQRGSAAQWLTMIRWMQAKQNLWQFEPDTENRIIVYLAENYPPKTDRRRAALSPDLMPQNPYAAENVNIQPIK